MLPSCGGTRVLTFYITTFSHFRQKFDNFFSKLPILLRIYQCASSISLFCLIITTLNMITGILFSQKPRPGRFTKRKTNTERCSDATWRLSRKRVNSPSITQMQPLSGPQTGNTDRVFPLSQGWTGPPTERQQTDQALCCGLKIQLTHTSSVCVFACVWTCFLWRWLQTRQRYSL